ncbi:hypothetical protein K525DRAFT_273855 [Schizophyllum commune Loenen D]|nr:hypothetical protein K525DRAFT_273855 [Schizophyllum commune Loenen D]
MRCKYINILSSSPNVTETGKLNGNPSTSSPHAPDGLRAHRCAGVLNGSATERPNVHHPKTARECQWRCHARASMSTLCKSVNVDAAQARQYRCRMCIDRNLRDKDINAPRELAQFREDRIAVCFPSRRFISNNLACPEWLVASRGLPTISTASVELSRLVRLLQQAARISESNNEPRQIALDLNSPLLTPARLPRWLASIANILDDLQVPFRVIPMHDEREAQWYATRMLWQIFVADFDYGLLNDVRRLLNPTMHRKRINLSRTPRMPRRLGRSMLKLL